jgi:hypothetical protein
VVSKRVSEKTKSRIFKDKQKCVHHFRQLISSDASDLHEKIFTITGQLIANQRQDQPARKAGQAGQPYDVRPVNSERKIILFF